MVAVSQCGAGRDARAGAVVRPALIAALLVVAGCKSPSEPTSFGLNIRIETGALDAGTRAGIVQAALHVTGDETYDTTLDVAKYVGDRELRVRYVPGVRTGALTIAIDGLAADSSVLASGVDGPIQLTDKGIDVPVVLGAPSLTDMGVPDLGTADLSPLPQGAACTAGDSCSSAGGCVDGYCCDTTCMGACVACSVPGREGTCSSVGAGFMPSAGHASCGPDPVSTCMRDGTCDGAGACELYAAGTVCASSTCASGTYTPKSVCDGKGACSAPAAISCSPYVCQDATTCYSSCTANAQCATPNTCSNPGTNGSCGLKTLGAPCTADGQCSSSHCAPEGICCDQACSGQCQYCESGTGACKYTSGAPASPRSACTGQGTAPCGGSCNGLGPNCTYPSTTTTCGPSPGCQFPVGIPVFQPQSYCNGTGSCATRSTVGCDPYWCNYPPGCYTSCTSDSQCSAATGRHCNTSNNTCG